jgi:hypothetical protein
MKPRIAAALAALLLAGCAVSGERPPGETAPPANATDAGRGSTAAAPPGTSTPPAMPTKPASGAVDAPPPAARTEPVPPPQPVTGEAPADLVAKMRADLVQRLAAEGIGDAPVVVTSEEVEWPDGSMGCGRPGQMYTMAIIPGYRVVFGVGPRRYAYHASRSGHFAYCAGAVSAPPASAGRSNPSV